MQGTAAAHPALLISVVVADDQPLIRTALRSLVDAQTDMRVVGEAADGWGAVSAVDRTRADVLIMDVRMPGRDGVEACRDVRSSALLRDTKVLMLTAFEEAADVLRSVRAGASGFLGKTGDPCELVEAVRAIHRGCAYLSARATRALFDHFVSPADVSLPSLSVLTRREHEVLAKVVRGRTNSEIATDLMISPITVKTHVNRIMAKVGVHDRAQLVVFAYESGVVLEH